MCNGHPRLVAKNYHMPCAFLVDGGFDPHTAVGSPYLGAAVMRKVDADLRKVHRVLAEGLLKIAPEFIAALLNSKPTEDINLGLYLPRTVREAICNLCNLRGGLLVGDFARNGVVEQAVAIAQDRHLHARPSQAPSVVVKPEPPETPPPVPTPSDPPPLRRGDQAVVTVPGIENYIFLGSPEGVVEFVLTLTTAPGYGPTWGKPFTYEDLKSRKRGLDVSVTNWFESFGGGSPDAPVLFQLSIRSRLGWHRVRAYPQPIFIDLTEEEDE